MRQRPAEATVAHLDWRPPGGGDPAVIDALERLSNPQVDEANRKAMAIILSGQPVLVDLRTAGETIPGMTRHMILHSGPPVAWAHMAGPQRGAVIGALMLEGLADSPEEAEALAAPDRPGAAHG